MKKKNNPEIHMEYFTYTYLKSLLETELTHEFKKYQDARGLIGELINKEDGIHPLTHNFDPYFKDKRAADQIWSNYQVRCQLIEKMKEELDFAYSKSAHPNMIAEKGFFETK
jgi:hypothetical protein